ncbi:unnamed protein product [Chrysoparadoxa australica]
MCLLHRQQPPEPAASDGAVACSAKSAVGTLLKLMRTSFAVAGKLWAELEAAKLARSFREIEMQVAAVLSGMEQTGAAFEASKIQKYRQAFVKREQELTAQAHRVCSVEFNLSSPEQVAEVLFGHLKLPSPPAKKGSKHASTSEEVLEKLKGKHPVVGLLLEHRAVRKMETTYLAKISGHIIRGRVYAQWNHLAVRTGRLSCSRPNLQQLPKFSEEEGVIAKLGCNIRDALVAGDGNVLLAADYSQIEFRVLAHACKDEGLLRIFAASGDLYSSLASKVLQKEVEAVTKEERQRAKVVCLGIIYGMGPQQLASKLHCSDEEARTTLRNFLKQFPRMAAFLDSTRKFARATGYVTTLTGLRRYLPEISSNVPALRAQGERQAVNSCIQGTASDCIKMSMVLVDKELGKWAKEAGSPDHVPVLILQVHDELVFQCRSMEEDVRRLRRLLHICMAKVTGEYLGISVDLAVNMEVGITYGSVRPCLSGEDEEDDDEDEYE